MQQSLARALIGLSLVVSLISFVLSLIGFYLCHWKHVQVRSTFIPPLASDIQQLDPLIRSEAEKYIDTLYRPGRQRVFRLTTRCALPVGERHSMGLSTHCLNDSVCGRNLLPVFHKSNYALCHNINYYRQCISSSEAPSNDKCACERPEYMSTAYTLLLATIMCHVAFLLVNTLRLARFYYHLSLIDDIPLRLAAIVATVFSSLFVVVILIQQHTYRDHEPLQFFEIMRAHYSRMQIYKFSNDLEFVVRQLQARLDVRFGASYTCLVLMLVLTVIAFGASSTVEIKLSPTVGQDDENDGEEEEEIASVDERKQTPRRSPIDAHMDDYFVPSEPVRFKRQTKV